MIVVEGPDGAGKTTLISRLALELNLPIAPRVVSKDAEAMVDLQKWVDENLEEGFQPRIFDRHRLISETIYGPILRYDQEPGFNEMAWLAPRMRRFYELEPIIIYCLPPFQTIWDNITDDPDNTAVLNKIRPIHSAYVSRAALDSVFAPGIIKVWDYTNSPTIRGLPTWLSEIKHTINQRTPQR